jgi:hypothetical protein
MFSLPAIVFPIPPLMIRTPALFAFGIQVSPPIVRFVTVFAMIVDRFVQPGFCLFDGMSAFVFLIGMYERCCRK